MCKAMIILLEILDKIFPFVFAVTKALQDAGIMFDEIEQACVGYVYGKIKNNRDFLFDYLWLYSFQIVCYI